MIGHNRVLIDMGHTRVTIETIIIFCFYIGGINRDNDSGSY